MADSSEEQHVASTATEVVYEEQDTLDTYCEILIDSKEHITEVLDHLGWDLMEKPEGDRINTELLKIKVTKNDWFQHREKGKPGFAAWLYYPYILEVDIQTDATVLEYVRGLKHLIASLKSRELFPAVVCDFEDELK